MKKFRVILSYHGCYSVEVFAENEEDARSLAEEKACELNDKEFISEIDLMEEDHFVCEIEAP